MALGTIADQLRCLADWFADDTVLRLWLLALANDEIPELADMLRALLQVERLIIVYQARLEGARIERSGEGYVALPLPEMMDV